MTHFHTQKTDEILSNLATSTDGLSATEAQNRLAKYGYNQLATAKKQPWLARFFAQFKDIMIILLLISAVISLVFGIIEKKGATEFIDTIIILFIVVLNAVLGVVQETKAENAMESLKNMSQPYSKVLRDHQVVFVKTNEIVVGDIVLLEAGDVVPADLRLIECVNLKCDESMLTGESVAIEKDADCILNEKTALGDKKNMCFSSSVITYGRGKGVVVATAGDTEIGKIAGMLNQNDKKEKTTLQVSLNKFAKFITVGVLIIAAVIFMIDIFITKQHWTTSLMTAIAIAVAAIPESMMIVVTIILSIGVTKLAKQNVIIRRLHSVETLGCCEVICSDKTGTITQNKMTVRKIIFDKTETDLANLDKDKMLTLFESMVLCNDAKIQATNLIGDPTETALLDCAQKFGYHKNALDKAWQRVNEIPFDSDRKLMTTVNVQNQNYQQFTKGAFDEIIKRCTHIYHNGETRKITPADITELKQANTNLCAQALRVLGFAYRTTKDAGDMTEKGLTFIGMVGMIDPPREEVYVALKKCRRAGMQAVMITGDHKDTAYAIAKELGMVKSYDEVVEGVHLDQFTDEELKTEVVKYKVYARVSPEHKVRIVQAFKALGKVVAMTGDGVNDAPSIKTAHIGVGMGKTGTDVTKQVADLILTDDNFATIVIAVEEGRKIYTNIQKSIQFLLGGNIAEVLAILITTLLFPQITFLVAVQILFVNLITDTLPAISLGMECNERDVMEQKPRKQNENIISKKIAFNIAYQGILQALIVIAVFIIGKNFFGNTVASTMGFLTLNLIQLVHIFNVRTNHSVFKSNPFKNKTLMISLVVEIGAILAIAFIPALANIFHLQSLSLTQWLICLGCSFLVIPIVEIVKLIQKAVCK